MKRVVAYTFTTAMVTMLVLFSLKMTSPTLRLDGYSGLLGARMSLGSEHTRYAPGYTDEKFLTIEKGMTKAEVYNILGAPLRKVINDDGVGSYQLIYSDSPTSEDYRMRSIQFTNHQVARINSGYYLD